MAKGSATKKIAGGLGLAALAAAAATTYYFYGKDGKKHRADAKHWGHAAKGEMLKKIKGMKQVSKQTYEQAVREVLAKYKQAKNIDPAELVALGTELKGHWDDISKNLAKMGAKKPAAKSRKAAPAKKARR